MGGLLKSEISFIMSPVYFRNILFIARQGGILNVTWSYTFCTRYTFLFYQWLYDKFILMSTSYFRFQVYTTHLKFIFKYNRRNVFPRLFAWRIFALGHWCFLMINVCMNYLTNGINGNEFSIAITHISSGMPSKQEKVVNSNLYNSSL